MRIFLALLFVAMTAGYLLSATHGLEGGLSDVVLLSSERMAVVANSMSVIVALLLPMGVFFAGLWAGRLVRAIGWPATLAGLALIATGAGAVLVTQTRMIG